MENNDLLDNVNIKQEIKNIVNSDPYTEPEKIPSFNGAYEFNEELPFEDEIRAFKEYYENRIKAICKYKSEILIGMEINRVLEVLKKRLERSNIPKEMRYIYEDMIMDLPSRVDDEISIVPWNEIPDTYEEIKTENKVK